MTVKPIRTLFAALLFLTALAVAQPPAIADQVSLTLISPPGAPSNGASLDNVYLSPYYFSINGSQTDTALICDDFNDEIYDGETWTANVFTGLQIPGISSGSGSGPASGLTEAAEATDYEEIADLTLALYATPSSDTTDQAALSYAIWSVFEDSAVQSYLSGLGEDGYYSSSVAPLLTQAQATVTTGPNAAAEGSYLLSILTVYTPVAGSQPSGDGTPQQFVTVTTPEASSPTILALDLLALFGAFFLVRRRVLWNAAARR